jgi:hypothetical protein
VPVNAWYSKTLPTFDNSLTNYLPRRSKVFPSYASTQVSGVSATARCFRTNAKQQTSDV